MAFPEKITNRQYKIAGAVTFVMGGIFLDGSLGLSTDQDPEPVAFIVLSSLALLLGLISFVTKPISLVSILGYISVLAYIVSWVFFEVNGFPNERTVRGFICFCILFIVGSVIVRGVIHSIIGVPLSIIERFRKNPETAKDPATESPEPTADPHVCSDTWLTGAPLPKADPESPDPTPPEDE